MRILIVGANGMIGSAFFRAMSKQQSWKVFGTLRSPETKSNFFFNNSENIFGGIDICNSCQISSLLENVNPTILINCAGITKQREKSSTRSTVIASNATAPHVIAEICKNKGIRMIHLSTDCVFSGKSGNYKEIDIPDSDDLYGRTKAMGEPTGDHVMTIRTSVIGHEISNRHGLLEWFLSQKNSCDGYKKAFFSGLTTDTLANVIKEHVIPNHLMTGLFNIAAKKISKYDLLKIIADVYQSGVHINPDSKTVLDRSLDPTRFNTTTGFIAPGWDFMVKKMYIEWRSQKYV